MRWISAAAASIVVTAGVHARAQEASATNTVRVDYSAPAICPDRTWFEGALHFRSERVIAVDASASAALDARVEVTATASGFHGALRMTSGADEATVREIDGARCASVVEALAFTAALLLDPEGINTATLPSDVELAQIAESARAKAEPAPPLAPPVSRPSAVPPPAPDRVTPPPPPTDRRLRFFGELGGGAWTAIAGIAPRAHLGLEARYETPAALAPYARLTGFGGPPAEETASVGSVSYVATGGRLDAGLLARLGAFRAGGSAHFTTLVMPVDAPSAEERLPSVRFVPSAGIAARASWEPSWLGLVVETSGGAHFVRESFVIETRDDPTRTGEVFRLPPLYVQATIGVLVHFGDLHGPLGR